MAALDEAGSDLRGDQLLALEHSQRVAAETDKQHRHAAIGSESGEQRLDHDVLVLAFVVEPERRRDGERLTFQLEPHAPIPVDGPSRRALERCEPLGEVGAADVAHRLGTETSLAADPESLLERAVLLTVLARGPDESDADGHQGHDRDGDDQDPDCCLTAHEVAVIVIPPRAFCFSVTRTFSAARPSASAVSSRIFTVSASQNAPSFR